MKEPMNEPTYGISRRYGLSFWIGRFELSLWIKQRRDLPLLWPRLYVWRHGIMLRVKTRIGAIQRDPVTGSSRIAP